MSDINNVPRINNKFLCIVNRNQPELSAVVSSYIQSGRDYSVFFEFPNVIAPNEESIEEFDENYISNSNAQVFSVKLFNAMQRVEKFDNVIYVGLTDEQKSFVDHIDECDIIEINNYEDVETKLRAYTDRIEYTFCRSDQLLIGLHHSLVNDSLLIINEDAEDIDLISDNDNGIVVVENENVSVSILAVNYAYSIGASIEIIDVPECSKYEIQRLIKEWKQGDEQAFLNLSSFAYGNIEHINFSQFSFATFFTGNYPYALVLRNLIPITQVKTLLDCDFFVFNAIVHERSERIGSGVVFSPLLLDYEEETGKVISYLEEQKLLVKKIIGDSATANELDNTLKEYPYEVFHICSHGGEIPGRRHTLSFNDRDGESHTVTYDQLVSFAPSHIEVEVAVTVKRIWRIFDDLEWMSSELKEKELPNYVFTDMVRAAHENKAKNGIKIDNVTDSCSIHCKDFVYQAMFNFIAGHRCYPFIFNNTCWSWMNVSESFIVNGASGYIGTLWDIDTVNAKEVAESFYNLVFDSTISEALHRSLSIPSTGRDADVYIYWGVHFSTLKKGKSIIDARMRIASNLLRGHEHRKEKHLGYEGNLAKNNSRIMNWIRHELEKNYRTETRMLIGYLYS